MDKAKFWKIVTTYFIEKIETNRDILGRLELTVYGVMRTDEMLDTAFELLKDKNIKLTIEPEVSTFVIKQIISRDELKQLYKLKKNIEVI